MKKEETLAQFTAALTGIAMVSAHIGDEFFVRKLEGRISDLTGRYVEFMGTPPGDLNVAQYTASMFVSISRAQDIVEYFQHLELAPVTPLLSALRALLELRLAIIDSAKIINSPPQKILEQEISIVDAKPESKNKPATKEELKLSAKQEKIFNFIKISPNARTKDIVEKFPDVSERTVKRSLKDLVGAGFLRKHSENKAVFYSAADKN